MNPYGFNASQVAALAPYYAGGFQDPNLALALAQAQGMRMPAPAPTRQPQSPPIVPAPQGCPTPYGGGGHCMPGLPFQTPGCGWGGMLTPEQLEIERLRWKLQCAEESRGVQRGLTTAAQVQISQIPFTIGTAAGVVVAAGATVTIRDTPSVPICGTKLVVERAVAPFFRITAARIGRRELFASAVGTPADLFTPDSMVQPTLEFPQLVPGQFFEVTVINADAADHPFFITLVGIPTEQGGACLA